jgi:hypothetical protein
VPWAAIIPAIAGLGGSLISSKMSSSAQKKAQEQAANSPDAIAQRNLINQQAGYGKQAGDIAGRLFPTYEAGVKELGDYFKSFLGEDHDAAMRSAAPLIRLRKGQTQGLLRGQDFAPRGGGRGEGLFNLYSDEQGDIYDTVAGERSSARQGFSQLIGDVGGRAQGLLASATGATGSSASLLGTVIDRNTAVGERASDRMNAQVGDIASGLGSLLIDLLRKKGGG